MKINVRMEGGLGDHLLANRFAPAILEKYPEAEIKIFSDTEDNPRSLDLILKCFPDFYKRGGQVIKERASKQFYITTQFGTENWPSCILNQKRETIEEMVHDCDIFYDLHIDGLEWAKSDFDWLRYYYHFPRPSISYEKPYEDGFVLAHLYSRPDSPYLLNQEYVISLLEKISKNKKVVILIEEKYKDFYKDLFNNKNIYIDTSDNLLDVFSLASRCSCFIGIDSGIRYMPYHFSKPTFVFSSYCQEYGNVIPSHLIRWLLYPKNVLPMHTNIEAVCNLINNASSNKIYGLFPEIPNQIENYIIDRKLQ